MFVGNGLDRSGIGVYTAMLYKSRIEYNTLRCEMEQASQFPTNSCLISCLSLQHHLIVESSTLYSAEPTRTQNRLPINSRFKSIIIWFTLILSSLSTLHSSLFTQNSTLCILHTDCCVEHYCALDSLAVQLTAKLINACYTSR